MNPQRPLAVLNVVGLTPSLLPHTPRLRAHAHAGSLHRLIPDLPAVTCTVQSSMLTGQAPAVHGVVGNGWYHREACEVQFWKQSNRLVHAEKVWETARRADPGFTCLNMFWWFNMYSSAEYSCTPRPIYKADGRKLPDCYSHPASLRDDLQKALGTFPLFQFWGPGASIASTQWIARASLLAYDRHRPRLTLVYLPHLDYGLQKLGPAHPDIPRLAGEVDAVAGELIDELARRGVAVMVVSEYGIEAVDGAIEVNRALRRAGLLAVREEQGLELLDAGASRAFAVVDHQVAHVYINDANQLAPRDGGLYREVRELCAALTGVEAVLDHPGQVDAGIRHARAGDLVLVAQRGKWFCYPYWLDEARAPDFARTVDIHRKPGYDPLELLIDPALRFPKLRIAWRLFQRKALRQRALLDLIPLDPGLARGSHGRVDMPHELCPLLMTPPGGASVPLPEAFSCRGVRDLILREALGRQVAGDDPAASLSGDI